MRHPDTYTIMGNGEFILFLSKIDEAIGKLAVDTFQRLTASPATTEAINTANRCFHEMRDAVKGLREKVGETYDDYGDLMRKSDAKDIADFLQEMVDDITADGYTWEDRLSVIKDWRNGFLSETIKSAELTIDQRIDEGRLVGFKSLDSGYPDNFYTEYNERPAFIAASGDWS